MGKVLTEAQLVDGEVFPVVLGKPARDEPVIRQLRLLYALRVPLLDRNICVQSAFIYRWRRPLSCE